MTLCYTAAFDTHTHKRMHAGLMPLLDEEVKLPRGSDAAWLSKCRQHNADHPALVGAAGALTVTFTVTATSITLCNSARTVCTFLYWGCCTELIRAMFCGGNLTMIVYCAARCFRDQMRLSWCDAVATSQNYQSCCTAVAAPLIATLTLLMLLCFAIVRCSH
jgi:hypothetical protein